MPIFAVMGVQFFEGEEQWAKGNAVHIVQQSQALAQQATLVSPGLAEDMPSWFGAFEVDEDTGELTLVEAWHLDGVGGVQDGIPVEEAEEEPEDPDPEDPTDPDPPAYPAWQEWDGINANLYQIGDIVTHNEQTWVAVNGDNHWEPGVFGWEVYTG